MKINIKLSYMIKAPIYPFLTGGLIVGGAKFVSDIASPLWASLLGAIPNDMVTPYFLEKDSDIINLYFESNEFIEINLLDYNVEIKYLSNKLLIQENTEISNAILKNSMIGNHVLYNGSNTQQEVSVGDYCEIK